MADPVALVDHYTDVLGPGAPAIEGRDALLAISPALSKSAVEIVADSVIGTDDLAVAFSWPGAAKRGAAALRARC